MYLTKKQILNDITKNKYLIDEFVLDDIEKYENNSLLLESLFIYLKKKEDIFIITKKELDIVKSELNNKDKITIINDMSNNSTSRSNYDNFLSYFQDRYNKISNILIKKIGSFIRISDLKILGINNKREINIIGMIKNINISNNQNIIIEIEDMTGFCISYIDINNEYLYNIGKNIILDEVLCIRGFFIKEKNIFKISKIIYPDVPNCLPVKYGDG